LMSQRMVKIDFYRTQTIRRSSGGSSEDRK
jgi:hypothetical protein